ncbi:hypothetical protein BOW53_06080 [Solemya pervernicosa gill symbiont]|uniref:LPS-assembly lipoprotein LptE n=2 Tax=Gammaproteobacteria incertae sedis TaxID=118884 RepID=A0A1T2L741_9GAMM|nr:hypothetical protein BOW53_06080 [Solemya pervernicosa gill symbiont]
MALVIVVSMAGCGYHLRGSVELPTEMARTHIDGNALQRKLTRELAERLRSNGVEVVKSKQAATAQLRILKMTSDRRTLTTGGKGDVQEYELYTEVVFDLRDSQGVILLEPQHVSVTRYLFFDPLKVRAKAGEMAEMRKKMNSAIVRQMLLRLRHAAPAKEAQ